MIPEDTQVENTETTANPTTENSDGFTIGSALGGYNTNTGTYNNWGATDLVPLRIPLEQLPQQFNQNQSVVFLFSHILEEMGLGVLLTKTQ